MKRSLILGLVACAALAGALMRVPSKLVAQESPALAGVVVCAQLAAGLDPQELAPSEMLAAATTELAKCGYGTYCCIRTNCGCGGPPPAPACCDATCSCECLPNGQACCG